MGKITAEEAETKAMEFVKRRHPRVRRILIRTVEREAGVWLVEGEVWFKRARLLTAKRSFRLQVSRETGQVKSYEEASNGNGRSL